MLALVAAGEPGARRAIEDAGRAVGRVLAGLVNVLNPEVIVVGGELPPRARPCSSRVRDGDRAATRSARPPTTSRSSRGALGDRAEVLGALILAAQRADAPHLSQPAPVP